MFSKCPMLVGQTEASALTRVQWLNLSSRVQGFREDGLEFGGWSLGSGFKVETPAGLQHLWRYVQRHASAWTKYPPQTYNRSCSRDKAY